MSKRQVDWARSARFELTFKLGGVCVSCSASRNLEFDCIIPQGHAHHTFGYVKCTSFYRRQYELKNLQLLCRRCHIKKSVKELPFTLINEDIEPF